MNAPLPFFVPCADRPLSVGLIGLGLSTLSAYEYLKDTGAIFSVRDKRTTLPDALVPHGIKKMRLGAGYLEDIDEDILILSPSVHPHHPKLTEAKARGVILTTECKMFYRLYDGELYAVTGSDGKSTTVSIAHKLLNAGGCYDRALLGGNIGTPLISLLGANDKRSACVAELSSFQLMHATPKAKRALITNLTPNHLDVHTSLEEYYNAKISLLNMADEPILNADDAVLLSYSTRRDLYAVYATKRLDLPRAEHAFLLEKDGITRDGVLLVRADALRPFSSLFCKNLLAAIALCDDKIDRATLAETVANLTPLPHRMETVCTVGGVRYVDSSADTTPSRTAATLSDIDGKIVLLAGGRGKGVSYDPILCALGKVRCAVLYGENREEIAEVLHKTQCSYTLAATLPEAVVIARERAEAGDTVLLSPMSTSHDQYTDYCARAKDFRATLEVLKE